MKKYSKNRTRVLALRISGFAFIGASLFFVILGVVIACAFQFLWAGHRVSASKPAAEALSSPGPWGRLEVTRMLLEKPAEMLPDTDPDPAPTRWLFAGRNREQTITFLAACGLSASQRATLDAPGVFAVHPDGCLVSPPADLVLALSTGAREEIYAELEKHPLNVMQQNPYCIQTEDADIWLSRVDLPKDKVNLVMKLTYRRGNALCFCDTAVARHFLSPGEFRALIRALYSTHTLRVHLRLQPGDSIDALAAYWGRGGRTSIVKALLESVARVPGGAAINVAALLPPLPRSWFCTYPDPPEPGSLGPDCYYSSLNFFRKMPEKRFLEPQFREEMFRREYQVVPKAEQLGDIIVFADARGTTKHACVYVAGDIVFTKNGEQISHPWVLMRLGEVRALYGREPGEWQIVFRSRNG